MQQALTGHDRRCVRARDPSALPGRCTRGGGQVVPCVSRLFLDCSSIVPRLFLDCSSIVLLVLGLWASSSRQWGACKPHSDRSGVLTQGQAAECDEELSCQVRSATPRQLSEHAERKSEEEDQDKRPRNDNLRHRADRHDPLPAMFGLMPVEFQQPVARLLDAGLRRY